MSSRQPHPSHPEVGGLRPSGLRRARSVDTWPKASHEAGPSGNKRKATQLLDAAHNVDNFNQNRQYEVGSRQSRSVSPMPKRQKIDDGAKKEPEVGQRQASLPLDLEQETHSANYMKDDSRQTGQEEAAEAERSIRTQRRVGVWKPSLAIGSSLSVEGEDLSRIEMADRKIIQRRTWLEFYGNTGYFPELLEKAISERTQLDENDEENTLPISSLASTHKRAIEERVGVLCEVLETSEFPPERANIQAAITGYETGAIPYSDSYTLIWGGSIVDTCPDYGSFTRDRSARLDRYLQEHGGGWLWYEPPLKDEIGGRGPSVINSRSPALAKKALCLDNTESWRKKTETMGHYRLEMGFRRRREKVARQYSGREATTARPKAKLATSAAWSAAAHSKLEETASEALLTLENIPTVDTNTSQQTRPMTKSKKKKTVSEPDPDGPRIFWQVLLDSGATLPCLFSVDLPLLRINPKTYAAQTAKTVATIDKPMSSRCYELDVGVFTSSSSSSTLVSSSRPPTWPSEPDILGATVPVFIFDTPPGLDSDNEALPDRLSGLVPFLTCYMSSAPGNYKLWLGEDRVDVLGSGRMPGQMRFHGLLSDSREAAEEMPAGHPDWVRNHLGTPDRVIFDHKGVGDGKGGIVTMREIDCGRGSSVILTGQKGVDFDQSRRNDKEDLVDTYIIDPRQRSEQQAAMRRREEALKGGGWEKRRASISTDWWGVDDI
ncbi:hypothetical protein B0H66DRAFT_610338 [Apodospora peruviana]|uniref:Uncharacterized protein n=1 Tax=Apodospora peruviana TaxID=516989 RepID=A0AAE0IQR6_9PEZI|nr:hypothetical protein B0H66DRAFT_610338 [Apodospora peruviana]